MDLVKHAIVFLVIFVSLGCSSDKSDDSSSKVQFSGKPGAQACSIIINKCSGCHMKGGSAPFPLTTYQEIKKKGERDS